MFTSNCVALRYVGQHKEGKRGNSFCDREHVEMPPEHLWEKDRSLSSYLVCFCCR